jgi:hypothetical protein
MDASSPADAAMNEETSLRAMMLRLQSEYLDATERLLQPGGRDDRRGSGDA